MKDVEAINREEGIALFDDGTTQEIIDWYDDSLDYCEPDDASFAICGDIRNGYWMIDLSKFEKATTQ